MKNKIQFLLLAIVLAVAMNFSTEYFNLIAPEISAVTPVEAQITPKMNPGEPLPSKTFVELAKLINPVVVNISTSTIPRFQRYGGRPGGPRDPFFEMFEQYMRERQGQQPRQAQPQQSLGTGFIIRKDGLILTNNHVIEQADVIQVQLSETDKTLYEAKVIGRDQRTDIALIKIEPKKDLPFARLGNSKDLEVGEWVAAFGNPFGHGHSMTKGIISAIGREINEINRFPFIQTDASINPGNSGGPLVNLRGEVIAVNTAIDARAQGIGFAIPIDEVKSILPMLEKDGQIQRAYLGVTLYPDTLPPRALAELQLPTDEGALIVSVLEGSPADKAGLQEYDFVVKFGSRDVKDDSNLRRAIEDSGVGANPAVEYYRDGKKRTAKINLKQAPNETAARPKEKSPGFPNAKVAPFNLGFKVSMLSRAEAGSLGLNINRAAPVITEVTPKSPAGRAGLRQGDIVVDVNRTKTASDQDVLKQLKANQVNSIRVFRGDLPILIYIEPK
jgi:serine protease Do